MLSALQNREDMLSIENEAQEVVDTGILFETLIHV
jgi:hypothetical protein